MRLLLIVNTSASSVTARARVVIQKALSADHEVALKETNRRGHAARLAQGAAADGVDVVVVLGGDGTLNEAANGLAGSRTALAVLPGGSTNVFARTIGMSNDPIEATSQLLGALATGPAGRVGLGQANARYFLFHAGIGFDAAVIAQVEKLAPLKRYLGPALFVAATLLTWAHGYDRKQARFHVSSEGFSEASAAFAVCLNTDPYTFFGSRPMHLAKGTALHTPLSLVTVDTLNLWALAPLVAATFADGPKTGQGRHVTVSVGVAQATVKSGQPLPYQLDGDFVGEAEQIELRWAPDALSLVRPV
ncbi:MAG TPA: diacylglycerol kinase family protein [Acidimicrobiales bacterium]|nr:diacylglycerol kinase family protein [Acidimicrobiales bacterium]